MTSYKIIPFHAANAPEGTLTVYENRIEITTHFGTETIPMRSIVSISVKSLGESDDFTINLPGEQFRSLRLKRGDGARVKQEVVSFLV